MTYGVAAVLVFVGVAKIEAWPLTSLHLFSSVRTDTTAGYELIALMHDGASQQVLVGRDNPVLATTTHLLRQLPSAPPQRQVALVEAWLIAGDVPVASVAAVRLERVTRIWDDAAKAWRESAREVVTQVAL